MPIYDGYIESPEVSRARRAKADELHKQWVEAQAVEWDNTPDGRRVCSSCGCFSYEKHYSHCKFGLAMLGPQEPPQDYRIFNRKQADGTYPDLADFFNNYTRVEQVNPQGTINQIGDVAEFYEDEGCGNDPHPYDFTPRPSDMPVIDIDGIEEIPF